jgi:O-antigen ligase
MLHSSQYALLILSYFAWAFLLVSLGAYLRRELGWEKIAITLSWFLVLGGIANIIFVALQVALNSGVNITFISKYPSYGTLAQPNNTADYIGLSLASLMYLYAKAQIKIKPFALGLVLFITLLAFTGSRTTWLYLGALTFLAIALQIKAIKQQNGSPQIRNLLRTSLLLLPLFMLIQWLLHNTLPDDLISLPAEEVMEGLNDKTGSARLQIWYDSWRIAIQSPWLGIGVGQTRWQSFLLLDTPTTNAYKHAFEHAHNVFLHLFTEMGILAPLIALVAVVAWVRGFQWRALNLETWWLIALLAIIGIHSQLEYPLWYAFFLGVAAFLLGAGDEKLTSITLPKMARPFAFTTLALVFAAGAANLSTLFIANSKLEKQLTISVHTGVKNYAQYESDLKWVYENSLLTPYAETMFVAAIVPNKAQIDDQIWLSEYSMRFMPLKQNVYNHVLLLKIKGDHAGAAKQLNRALLAHPVKKITKLLETVPKEYWTDYLEVLNAVRPIKKIPKSEFNPLGASAEKPINVE